MFVNFFSYFMDYCGIGDVIVNPNKFELILNRSFHSDIPSNLPSNQSPNRSSLIRSAAKSTPTILFLNCFNFVVLFCQFLVNETLVKIYRCIDIRIN